MAKKQEILAEDILNFLKFNPGSSSKGVHESLNEKSSYSSVKRVLQQQVEKGFVATTGAGKATRYGLTKEYDLLHFIDTDLYFRKEIDERIIKTHFDHRLIGDVLMEAKLFRTDEFSFLNNLQDEYQKKILKLTGQQYKRELERLAIDLSWKSSQIEGNTYSLLETEQLLKESKTAAGKTKDEAMMLLNHKSAIDFMVEHPDFINPIKISAIEDIHSLLTKDLNVERNIRNGIIGISGTNYKPLDNEFQIREALDDMINLVNYKHNVFEKALIVLLLISYIQPFADGNKRTARIISNGILMNFNCCPLSFRTVDPLDYKKAMLIFYEQNNLSAFKKIFIDQYEFAVRTYF